MSVVRVEEEHVPLLAEFYRRVWDPDATPEGVLRARRQAAERNQAEPGIAPPTVLLLLHGEAVGHVTTIPCRLWDGTSERPGYWIKGLMVLPEHRRGPVGYLVLKEAVRRLSDFPTMGMVVAPEARALFEALGYRDLGPLRNSLRLLHPGRVVRRVDLRALGVADRLPKAGLRAARALQASPLAAVGGAFLRLGIGLWSGVAGRASLSVGAASSLPNADWLERAWGELRGAVAAAPARSGTGAHARFGDEEHDEYAPVTLERKGGLGYAVVRRPRAEGDRRLNGIRVATLSELVVSPRRPAAVLGLLAAAERRALALGADALLVTTSHASLRPLLRRRAYFPFPGNIHLLLRPAPGLPSLPSALDQWWLMRGDSAADDVF